MTKANKILIVDDNPLIIKLLNKFLHKEGYQTIEAKDGIVAMELVKSNSPDIIVLDIQMPQKDGIWVLNELNRIGSTIPVFVITGFTTMDLTIKALELGAVDHFQKPLNLIEVSDAIQKCLSKQQLDSKSKFEEKLIFNKDKYELIGKSPAMHKVFKAIGKAARTPKSVNVLIHGETGTGKELVAHQIHRFGHNPDGPFVSLNMTALADGLLESELFGYERGAFTGADHRTDGKFELAGEGSIFLDEIGHLSPQVQMKLLRVISRTGILQCWRSQVNRNACANNFRHKH